MKEILFNLALIDTINFCKENGIDCSGSHLVKYPRKQTYALIKDVPGQKSTGWKMANVIVTVTFHKSSVPTHTYNPELIKNKSQYCMAQVGEKLCGKKSFKDECCEKHYYSCGVL